MGTSGNYTYQYETESSKIFPETRDGTHIMVTHIKWIITLTNLICGSRVVFYITKKGLHYDSRSPRKSVSPRFVVEELERMLGKGVGSSVYNSALGKW